MQGRARLGESKLGAKLTWDAKQSTSLEVKELGEQVSGGPVIYLVRG